jgi:polyisoprenoid-binding protein YceI
MRPCGHAAPEKILVPGVLLFTALVFPGAALAKDWALDTSRSRVIIHVLPAGLLSAALHEHHFQPESWSADVAWDPQNPAGIRLEARFAADSLRDAQSKLSARDIAKVEGQTRGPEVLDAKQFPKVVFKAEGAEVVQPPGADGAFRGTLTGSLTLHGQTRPLRVEVTGRIAGDRLEASATAVFKQSDFGMKPYRTALGTIAVRDEVSVEIAIVASPR